MSPLPDTPAAAAALPARCQVPPTAGLPLQASDWWPRGQALDAALAAFLQQDEVLLACSGTAAFVAALECLKALAPERDSVVVPAYTCPLVALAIVHCGLKVVCCDVLPAQLDMDPQALHALCTEKTLAVVPTHLGGRITDVQAAVRAARAVGAWVIEDAAQALGAQVAGRSVGLQGDIGFFSLAVGKGLTLYEGGVLVAQDADLREGCRQRLQAQSLPSGWMNRLKGLGWDARRTVELLGYGLLYRPRTLPLVYGNALQAALRRGDWIEAAGDDFDQKLPLHRVGRWRRAVGANALQRLPKWLAQTEVQALQRIARLRQIPGLRVIEDSSAAPEAHGTWPVLLLLLPTAEARTHFISHYWGAGLGLSLPFVHALPDYDQYRGAVAQAPAQALPAARDLAARIVAISNSPWLDEARFGTLLCVLKQTCLAVQQEVLGMPSATAAN